MVIDDANMFLYSLFFFGGLSIHLSTAVLAHMFSYNMYVKSQSFVGPFTHQRLHHPAAAVLIVICIEHALSIFHDIPIIWTCDVKGAAGDIVYVTVLSYMESEVRVGTM
jgi:hypothetical protein